MTDAILQRYCKGVFGGGIVEEVITQDLFMEQFHPDSVNTVRIPTIRLDDRTVIFHPFFRVGRGNAIVDNAGAGGIICALDAKDGTIIAAADEKGVTYIQHPETNVRLVGNTIPRWNEAIEFAKRLAEVVPTNRYTGWDIALTKDGWRLIEGNARGQFVAQIPLQYGFRTEIEGYLQEIKKHD